MTLLRNTLLLSLCIIFYVYSTNADELRIASPHWEGYKREFEWSFVEWYRERTGKKITIRWLDLGGASDTLRYILSQAKQKQFGDLGIDVFFGGGMDPFIELKRQNLLLPIVLPESVLRDIPQSLGGNPVYDPQGYWFSVNLAGFGIIYNKNLLSRYKLPTPLQWSDLADPRFRGWIGSADPRKSGSVRFMYELILQYYGWDKGWKIIYGISANIRSFSSNSSQTPKDVALGEIAAGLLIDSYARDAIREVGEADIGFSIPGEFPAVYGDAVSILRGTPSAEIGALFIEFCLSQQAQELLMKRVGSPGGPKRYELGKMSVRPDVYLLPKSELLDISPPWSSNDSFRYDSEKAARRWSVTTALLGILVDNKDDLVAAANKKARFFEALPPPLTEQEVDSLTESASWKDPKQRSVIISQTQSQLLRNLHAKADKSIFRYIPFFGILLGIVWIIISKVFRRYFY